MTPDELEDVTDALSILLEGFIKLLGSVYGQCPAANLLLCDAVRRTIRERVPGERRNDLVIVVGNIKTNGEQVWEEAAARKARDRIVNPRKSEFGCRSPRELPCHMWLTYGRYVVDLSLVSTLCHLYHRPVQAAVLCGEPPFAVRFNTDIAIEYCGYASIVPDDNQLELLQRSLLRPMQIRLWADQCPW